MADPGFPRGGGANPKGGGRQPIIWPIFPKNCMKMKKFWARGGGASLAPPLRSSTANVKYFLINEEHFFGSVNFAIVIDQCKPPLVRKLCDEFKLTTFRVRNDE